MTRRSPVPPSPAFEATARDVPFRDRIAVVVKAPPEAIFQALHEVTLRDMKFAWLLGELRYLSAAGAQFGLRSEGDTLDWPTLQLPEGLEIYSLSQPSTM